ncbi:hypothetical protein [Streptomyces marincola]|uniref:hypothetical protein n=1 Tax=Streptomyces marincola TaxID=2878388 RepID=UPI001CF3CEFC|nr:hypothetical protein [Streptomyces marincola]UCM88675.1 hypothetical protein LC193_12315 [Streptomyces marincola]
MNDGWDIASFWEKEPRVLDGPRLDEETLFGLAVAAAARRAGLPDPQDVRVFADDGTVTPARVDAYLPSAGRDGSFARYAERMLAAVGSFALTINSLQQFGWDFWQTLRRATDPVLAAGGWSAGGVDCHLIASVYGTAPTLVHKDTAGVFTYVVRGFKRFYTWPYEVFAGIAGEEATQRQVNLPASIRPEDHLDTATVVEGGPGSVLYWPSDRWHCAMSDGRLAVSLHLAHYQWDDRLALLLRRVRRLAASELGTGRFEGGPVPEAGPGGDRSTDAQVRKVVSRLVDDSALDLDLRLRRLKRRTASNFEVIPPPRPCPDLSATPGPLTVPEGSVARTLTADGVTYLAVNGHILRITGGAWLDAFLPWLVPGAAHSPEEWANAAAAAGGPSGPECTAFLGELVKRGALTPGEADA